MSALKLFPTLPLGADETPTGYISRLAALHHSPHVRSFCTDLGLPFQAIVDGDENAIKNVAHLTGADYATMTRNTIVRDGTGYRIRGEALTKNAALRTTIRICPKCAADDIAASSLPPELAVQSRLSWNIASIRTCARHNTALAQIAVAEGRNETHDFAQIIRTNFDKLKNLPAVERPPSALETYLIDRLDGAAKTQPWLDGLEFHAAARICELIGAVANGGRDINIEEMSEDERYAAGSAGFAIAASGESDIRAFLKTLQDGFPASRGANQGPQAIFGQLYKLLAYSWKDAAFDPIRDIMRRHIIETTPVSPGDTILGKPVEKRVLHSIYTATNEFGAHRKRLRKILAAKNLLPPGYEDKPDNHVLFDASIAQALHEAGVFDGLSLKDIETYTGAGRVQVKLLFDAGILKPVTGQDENSDTPINISFARKDVDAFLENLQQDAQPVDAAGDGQFNIPQTVKRANCSTIEIIQMILARELDWVGRLPSENIFNSILIDLDEIKRKTRLPELDGLTTEQVCDSMNTTNRVVVALIEHGILQTERRIHPIKRCPIDIVTTTEFERFQATYVTLFELAKERGVHHLQLKAELEGRGIKPALDPELFRATFYNRNSCSVIPSSPHDDEYNSCDKIAKTTTLIRFDTSINRKQT